MVGTCHLLAALGPFKTVLRFHVINADVHIALVKTNESIARNTDKHRRDITFHTGDLVYVNTAYFSLAPGLSRKLAPK